MKLPFLRKSADTEPLVVSMTGVKLGERVLYYGASSQRLVALAARTGLSGRTALLPAGSIDEARSLETAATREGVLIDALPALEAGDHGAFDLAVLDAASLSRETGAAATVLPVLRDSLRAGGRLIAIEPGPRHGLRSRLMPGQEPGDSLAGPLAALVTRVRTIGERDGLRFLEGFRSSGPGVTG